MLPIKCSNANFLIEHTCRFMFGVRHLEVLDLGVILYFLSSQALLSSFYTPATNLIDGGKAKLTIKRKKIPMDSHDCNVGLTKDTIMCRENCIIEDRHSNSIAVIM